MDPENKRCAEHVLVHRLSTRVKSFAPGCAGQPHILRVSQRLVYCAELHHDSRRDELVNRTWTEEVAGKALWGVVLNGIAQYTLGANILLVICRLPKEQKGNISKCLHHFSWGWGWGEGSKHKACLWDWRAFTIHYFIEEASKSTEPVTMEGDPSGHLLSPVP